MDLRRSLIEDNTREEIKLLKKEQTAAIYTRLEAGRIGVHGSIVNEMAQNNRGSKDSIVEAMANKKLMTLEIQKALLLLQNKPLKETKNCLAEEQPLMQEAAGAHTADNSRGATDSKEQLMQEAAQSQSSSSTGTDITDNSRGALTQQNN